VALASGAVDNTHVRMGLAKTCSPPRFAMMTDRFGVSWMTVVIP